MKIRYIVEGDFAPAFTTEEKVNDINEAKSRIKKLKEYNKFYFRTSKYSRFIIYDEYDNEIKNK